MKVTLISHGFQPNYEKAFANGLARNGVKVSLVSSSRTLVDQLDEGVHAIPLRGSQDPRRGSVQKLLGLLRYVFSLMSFLLQRRHEALHMTGMFITSNVPLGLLEAIAYRSLCRRFLLTVHNILPHDRHTRLNAWVTRMLYRMPHVLVVHTRKMRETLVDDWGVSPDRVVVMEHGVDDLPMTTAAWKPDPEGRLRLLMFGAVARYKGIDLALSALDGLEEPKVSLSIVGMCRDAQLAGEIETALKKVPAPHHAGWRREYVPEGEVQSIFESADAVLLPYRHIDQSGVLLTAYRFGLPVAAFDVGSFAHYIRPETGILIEDRSVDGLRMAMKQLQVSLASFDRDAIRRFAANYLWENTVRVLLPHYA